MQRSLVQLVIQHSKISWLAFWQYYIIEKHGVNLHVSGLSVWLTAEPLTSLVASGTPPHIFKCGKTTPGWKLWLEELRDCLNLILPTRRLDQYRTHMENFGRYDLLSWRLWYLGKRKSDMWDILRRPSLSKTVSLGMSVQNKIMWPKILGKHHIVNQPSLDS